MLSSLWLHQSPTIFCVYMHRYTSVMESMWRKVRRQLCKVGSFLHLVGCREKLKLSGLHTSTGSSHRPPKPFLGRKTCHTSPLKTSWMLSALVHYINQMGDHKMAEWVEALDARLMTWILSVAPESTWWKLRNDSLKLSANLWVHKYSCKPTLNKYK